MGIQETTSVGELAINNAGEYFQDCQCLMKHKQISLSLTTNDEDSRIRQTAKTPKTDDDSSDRPEDKTPN